MDRAQRALSDTIEAYEAEAQAAEPTTFSGLSLLWRFPLIYLVVGYSTEAIVCALMGVQELDNLVKTILYVTTFIFAAFCSLLWVSLPWIKTKRRTDEDKKKAQFRYNEIVAPVRQETIAIQEQIKNSHRDLKSLQPCVAEQKSIAMEQAKLLWASDMIEKGDEIQRCAAQCDRLYGQLVALGSVPSERDWPAIDDVVDKIASGRADSLKEALLLIDTDERHRELMSVQVAQLNEHVKLREQLKVDVGNLTRQIEQTRSEIQRQHSADRAQRDYQHAQQMAAEAAQIAIQAAAYREQCKFHNEARQQPQYKPVP